MHPGLLEVPNVVLTPHIASASVPTRRAMANLAADNLIAALGRGAAGGDAADAGQPRLSALPSRPRPRPPMTDSPAPRSGGRILVDQLVAQGVERADLRARRELSRRARRAPRRRDRRARLPPRGRRRHDGRGLRQADRPARHLLRDARAGRHQRRARLHIARQDSTPMILFVGQVERGHARARGVPGDRLPRGVRRDGEMGGRDRRRRRASPRSSRAPSASPCRAGPARS